MVKGGNGRCRTQQNRNFPSLRQELHAYNVPLYPGIKQALGGVRGFRRHPTEKFFQDRTQLRFVAASKGREKHPPGNAEEFPPELPCRLQAGRTKRNNLETSALECLRGAAYASPGFSGHRRTTIVFKIADADAFQIFCSHFAQGNRGGARIAVIGSGHSFE